MDRLEDIRSQIQDAQAEVISADDVASLRWYTQSVVAARQNLLRDSFNGVTSADPELFDNSFDKAA